VFYLFAWAVINPRSVLFDLYLRVVVRMRDFVIDVTRELKVRFQLDHVDPWCNADSTEYAEF
jgi:hypothetical protein